MEYLRGEIVVYGTSHISGDNSIQRGTHPGIIVSNDINNEHSPNVHLIPGTSNIEKCKLPTHFILTETCGLRTHTLFMAEQQQLVPKTAIMFKVGRVPDNLIYIVDRAISIQNGLIEPFDINKVRKLISEIEWIDIFFKTARMETKKELLLKEMYISQLEIYCKRYNYDYKNLLRQHGTTDHRGVAMCG